MFAASETGLNIYLDCEDIVSIQRGLRMRGYIYVSAATIREIADGFMPHSFSRSQNAAFEYVYRRCVALS